MSNTLIISLIVFSIFLFITTFYCLRKGLIPVKYSLPWFIVSVIIFLLGVFPFVLEFISNLIGIVTLSNLIIAIILVLLLIITLVITTIVSKQKKMIKLLVQELSLTKKYIGDKNDSNR